ncbi:MAG: Holliday junction resolvase YqgF [Candidatus Magasanikbacteria bacterium]|nr:Holliday junction resolvase YqgF [Candidatus Magasanikbacteria bacterium]
MKRVLGIDYGERRVGLAIADEGSTLAVGYGVLENRGVKELCAEIAKIVVAEDVSRIVVGMPLTLSGKVGPQAIVVQDFVSALRERVHTPVDLMDERFTSIAADKAGAKQKDIGAAVEILAAYMQKRAV